MFYYDVHVHTAEASKCSPQPAAEMVDEYKRKNYTGIIVTDHFLNGNTRVPKDLPWDERIRQFALGYEHAKARGDEIGLDVFFALEASFEGNDFLTYGLDMDWLIAHPDLLSLSLKQYLELVRSEGGFVVHAHPFRDSWYIPAIRLVPQLVDAVEIHNFGRPAEENAKNHWYAEMYDLPQTAGSDAHQIKSIPERVIGSSRRFAGVCDYISAVRNRELVVY